MNQRPLLYFIFSLSLLSLIACRQAKYVEEGAYLLDKNEIQFKTEKDGEVEWESGHSILDGAEMEELIRPVPNRKFKLFVYNRIDTTRHAKQVDRKKKKFKKKNDERQDKEDRINEKRIKKAKKKGKEFYRKKIIKPKPVKLGWREWVRVNAGEPPVLLDTFKMRKTKEQLEIYLKKHGFYYGNVEDTVYYNERKKKATVSFQVESGKPYIIKAITFDSISRNRGLIKLYDKMQGLENSNIVVGDPLDEEKLDAERERFASYCRNNAYFEFNKSYINYEVDTSFGNYDAVVKIFIKQKTYEDTVTNTMVNLRHKTYHVSDVTFLLYNPDTSSFKNGFHLFRKKCDSLGIEEMVNKKYSLLDTIRIDGKGNFIYNEKPFLKPDLLDDQNFLEMGNWYKEYYVERSYRTLNKLDVFSSITMEIDYDPKDIKGDSVVVTYHLIPKKRQSFLMEPRTTNTNGVLGISGALTYTNRNCFRGAQRLKVSFVGGVEAQPNISRTADSSATGFLSRINTFEWGPSLSLTFPKLVPMPKKWQDNFSKRLYPSTEYTSLVNVQRRSEFVRFLGEFAYSWNFREGKTREWKVDLINFNFVKLNKEQFFIEDLAELNDPFLLNSYSDHLTTSIKVNWHYNNRNANRRINKNIKHIHDVKVSLMESGNVLYGVGAGKSALDTNGLRTILGVPYTQFVKFDVQYVANQHVNDRHKIAYRLMAGAGFAYQNSPSMPYEHSFFAGGSNDIRAFPARTMAPGATQKYIDPDLTQTQIGDMRLELNVEWRFKMLGILEGALFADAGNIWMILPKDDPSVAAFRFNSFLEQSALGGGFGMRADLDFLIIRLDMAVPIYNPYLPETERWITKQHKPIYLSQIDAVYSETFKWTNPHRINFSLGIGYPF